MILFEVVNADDIAAALAQVEDLPAYLNSPFVEWAEATLHNNLWGMKNYAAPRPGSSYERTGDLGMSWDVWPMGESQVLFENWHQAAELVVGENQAWMHEGRWWRAYDRIEEQGEKAVSMLVEQLNRWPN